MNPAPIGLALVGCGRFGRILGQAAASLDRFTLVWTVDSDASLAAGAATELGASAAITYEQVLERPEVDAVLLATTHGSHRELAVAAARAGKHVFCEKPMAISFDDCQAMIDAASGAGVTLLVGHLYRLMPLVQQARALLESGIMGRPLAVASTRSSHVARRGWWADRQQYGGLLHSPGIHNIDLMNHFLGRPRSVFALSPPPVQREVDYPDTSFVSISYEDGLVGSLYASMSDPLNPPDGVDSFRVLCERGALEFDFIPPGRLVTSTNGVERVYRGRPGDQLRAGANQAIRAELLNFAATVTGEAAPFIHPQEAAAAVAVCEAAYESAVRRAAVSVRRPEALPGPPPA